VGELRRTIGGFSAATLGLMLTGCATTHEVPVKAGDTVDLPAGITAHETPTADPCANTEAAVGGVALLSMTLVGIVGQGTYTMGEVKRAGLPLASPDPNDPLGPSKCRTDTVWFRLDGLRIVPHPA